MANIYHLLKIVDNTKIPNRYAAAVIRTAPLTPTSSHEVLIRPEVRNIAV